MDPSMLGPMMTFIGLVFNQQQAAKRQQMTEMLRLEEQSRQAAIARRENRELQREVQEGRQKFDAARDQTQHEFRKEEDLARYALAGRQQRGGLVVRPGGWKSAVFAEHGGGPFVLFDTVLRQDHDGQFKLPFNPLQFVAEQFKTQTSRPGNTVKVATVHEGFNSDAHARHFVNSEFEGQSVVVVHGTFTGNRLSFNALYSGITADQIYTDPDTGREYVLTRQMHDAVLGRFPYSLFREFGTMTGQAKTGAQGQTVFDPKLYEDVELLFDFVVNTSLQVLVDQFMALKPEVLYEPQAGALLRQKKARLKEAGLWVKEVDERFRLHEEQFHEVRRALALI